VSLLERIARSFGEDSMPSFINLYEETVRLVNSAISGFVDAEEERLQEIVNKMYLNDILRACQVSIDEMRAKLAQYQTALDKQRAQGRNSLTPEEASVLANTQNQQAASRLEDLEKIVDQIKPKEREEKAQEKTGTRFKIPTAANLTDSIIDDLDEEHGKAIEAMMAARIRADRAASRAQEIVDRNLTVLAEKLKKTVRDKTGRSVTQVRIVDSLDDLDEIKEQIYTDRLNKLIAALPPAVAATLDDDKEAMSKIVEAANLYKGSVLSHIIFCVRNAERHTLAAEKA